MPKSIILHKLRSSIHIIHTIHWEQKQISRVDLLAHNHHSGSNQYVLLTKSEQSTCMWHACVHMPRSFLHMCIFMLRQCDQTHDRIRWLQWWKPGQLPNRRCFSYWLSGRPYCRPTFDVFGQWFQQPFTLSFDKFIMTSTSTCTQCPSSLSSIS